MKLWHTDITDTTNEWYNQAMGSLPELVFKDIDRYHQLNDKKSRLLSRLLVKMYCLENGFTWNWSNWKVDDNKKPYFENGPFFNISHAGDKVVVVFSENHSVGVDVEKITEIGSENLSVYFHHEERHSLEPYSNDAFFKIWTRKEALLKAIGIGILNGLNQVSVLNDDVDFNGHWHIKDVSLFSDYKLAVCSPLKETKIELRHIDKEQLKSFIDEKIFL